MIVVVEPGYMISLCSSCFQRGYQLRAAMGPNLAHAQRRQPYARWVVLLCKDDWQGQQLRADLELEALVKLHLQKLHQVGSSGVGPRGARRSVGLFPPAPLKKETHRMPQQ